jgi:hypothetical protein
MSGSERISWSILQKVMDYCTDNFAKIIGAKDLMPMTDIEKVIPNLFKDLHDIINPALIECGKIKEKDIESLKQIEELNAEKPVLKNNIYS